METGSQKLHHHGSSKAKTGKFESKKEVTDLLDSNPDSEMSLLPFFESNFESKKEMTDPETFKSLSEKVDTRSEKLHDPPFQPTTGKLARRRRKKDLRKMKMKMDNEPNLSEKEMRMLLDLNPDSDMTKKETLNTQQQHDMPTTETSQSLNEKMEEMDLGCSVSIFDEKEKEIEKELQEKTSELARRRRKLNLRRPYNNLNLSKKEVTDLLDSNPDTKMSLLPFFESNFESKKEMTDPETFKSLSEKMELGMVERSSHRRRAAKGKKKLSFEDDPNFLNGKPFLIYLKTSNYDTSVCHNLARLSVSHIDKTDQYYRSDHVLVKLFSAKAWKDVGDRILFILSYSARELGAGKKKLLIFDTYVLYDCGVEEMAEVAAYYDRTRQMTPQEKYIYSRRFVRSGGFDVPDMPCIKWTGEIVQIHLHLRRSLKKLCVEFAELAVATFNKKKPEGSEGELELVELVKAMRKQNFEKVYYLTFEARYMHDIKVQKIYQAIVRTRNRSKEPELLCFRLKDSRSWLWKLDGFDAPDSYNYPIREDNDDDTSSWEDTSTWEPLNSLNRKKTSKVWRRSSVTRSLGNVRDPAGRL